MSTVSPALQADSLPTEPPGKPINKDTKAQRRLSDHPKDTQENGVEFRWEGKTSDFVGRT